MRYQQAAAVISLFSVGLFLVLAVSDASALFRGIGSAFVGPALVVAQTASSSSLAAAAGSVERYTSMLFQDTADNGWLTNYTVDGGAGRAVPLDGQFVRDVTLKSKNAVFVRSVVAAAGASTSMLYVVGFSNPVPADSRVTGVKVSLNRRAAEAGLRDSRFGLVVAGAYQPASNKCPGAASCLWPVNPSMPAVSFGGAGDLWGLSPELLTPANVNANRNDRWTADGGFGFAFATENTLSDRSIEALVDAATMTVYYGPATAEPATTTASSSNGGAGDGTTDALRPLPGTTGASPPPPPPAAAGTTTAARPPTMVCDTYLDLRNNAGQLVLGTEVTRTIAPLTLSFWLYSYGTQSKEQTIVVNGNFAINGVSVHLLANNVVGVSVARSGLVASTYTMPVGSWYFISAVSAEPFAWSIFEDAVLKSSFVLPSVSPVPRPDGKFAVGGHAGNYNGADNGNLNGRLDSLQFWTVARSAAQLASDMAGVTGFEANLVLFLPFKEGAGNTSLPTGTGASFGTLRASGTIGWGVRSCEEAPPATTASLLPAAAPATSAARGGGSSTTGSNDASTTAVTPAPPPGTTGVPASPGGFIPDQKPRYHLRPDIFWMSDVCGPFVWNGVYHVFYQNTPDKLIGNMCWGHAVSRDLLHWTLLPPIMCPDVWYDIEGVFDGSTFFTDQGPMILYCGIYGSVAGNPVAPKSMNLAYPANLSDPYLTEWIKAPYNPIVKISPPELITILDPGEIWRDPDGSWHFSAASGVLGNETLGKPHLLAVAHFVSDNLTNADSWKYKNLMATTVVSRPGWFICAEYFDLNGVGVTSFAPFYQLGTYTPSNGSWVSTAGGLGVYDSGTVICMKSFDDRPRDRRIAIGWVPEADSLANYSARNWAGVMTLPRTLAVSGTGLLSPPIPEVDQLRRDLKFFSSIVVPSGTVYRLPGVSGDQVEINFRVKNWRLGGNCGLRVRASTNNEEYTELFFQGGSRIRFGIDRTFSSLNDRVLQGANSTYGFKTSNPSNAFGPKDPMNVRLFLDHSLIELYINDGAYRSALRIYPSRADSVFIDLYANGASPVFENVSVWQMADVWIAAADSSRKRAALGDVSALRPGSDLGDVDVVLPGGLLERQRRASDIATLLEEYHQTDDARNVPETGPMAERVVTSSRLADRISSTLPALAVAALLAVAVVAAVRRTPRPLEPAAARPAATAQEEAPQQRQPPAEAPQRDRHRTAGVGRDVLHDDTPPPPAAAAAAAPAAADSGAVEPRHEKLLQHTPPAPSPAELVKRRASLPLDAD